MYIEVLDRVDYLKILGMFLNAWNDILEKMDYLVKSDLKLSALFLMTYYCLIITIMITLAATRRIMKLIVMNLKLYQQNNMEQANILYAKREGTTHHHSKIP